MEKRTTTPGQFPSRISRSVSLALTGIIVIVLVVGGISLFMAFQIYRINDAVDQEHGHVLLVEQVHTSFHHIIFELHHMQSTGDFQRMGDVQMLHQDLDTTLQAFRGLHKDEVEGPEYPREPSVLASVEELAASLRGLTDRLMAVPVAARRLGSDEADQLRIISHQILRLADDLRNLHRTRVTHLLEASRRLMWLIVTLYLIFLIVGGGLIAVTSIAFNRGITSPLKRLAEATTKIAEGHLEERVPVRSSHEIGKLSHAFNVMADRLLTRETELETAQTQLEQRIREAQALYRLGTEISGLRDLNRILQFVVDSARELLHTDAAALSLLNPEQEALVVRAMSGSPEAFQLGVSVMRSFPLIGPLEAHSQYRHVMRPEYLRGHLSAVLSRGPKAIGVICVASRETREFTLAENELLSALATQAAIAIENARLNEEVQSVGILKERERIAREMHDGLAQSLALLHLRLQRAQQQAATANMVETARDLRDMAAIADHTYEEVRQSIFGLRTMVFRSLGLIPTLTEYLHDFSVQSGIPVSLDVPDGLAIHLPPEAEVQLLRIIQEALANVRKHAGANQAWVRLSRQDSWVQAIIEDDGQGFDPTILAKDDRRHVGLQSMRERAAGVGGRLEIDTAPGRGTRVKAWLPGEG